MAEEIDVERIKDKKTGMEKKGSGKLGAEAGKGKVPRAGAARPAKKPGFGAKDKAAKDERLEASRKKATGAG